MMMILGWFAKKLNKETLSDKELKFINYVLKLIAKNK